MNTKNNGCIEHKKRVQVIFKDLASNSSEFYVKVEQFNYSNTEDYKIESVVLSILTEKIYKYDKETILNNEKDSVNQKVWIEDYCPFFVSVVIPITENNASFFKKMDNNWVCAKFTESDENQNNNVFSAFLICSAPYLIMGQNKRIEINPNQGPYLFHGQNINDLTQKNYNPQKFNSCLTTPKNIESELNKAWNYKEYDYIDIYNLGHGNADYIVSSKKRILYDIGLPRSELSLNSYKKTKSAFKKLKPNLVIISHWDTDHYRGCVYARNSIFDVMWIAPQLDKTINTNLFRLAAYLKVKKKLMLVSRKQAGIFQVNSNNNLLKIRMGGGKGTSDYVSPKNREGLYIELLRRDNTSSILAGDVPYNSMDTNIFNKELTFLHVPHHCSKMKLDNLQKSIGGKYAIISSKLQPNGNYTDNSQHLVELKNKFKNVTHTSEKNTKILSIRLRKIGILENRK